MEKSVDKSVEGSNVMPGRNGGTLRRGNLGGKGGGRRADRIKKLAEIAVAQRIPILKAFVDGVAVQQVELPNGLRDFKLQSPTPSERVKAFEALNKLRGEQKLEVGEIAQRLQRQVGVILSRDSWDAHELVAVLSEVWR